MNNDSAEEKLDSEKNSISINTNQQEEAKSSDLAQIISLEGLRNNDQIIANKTNQENIIQANPLLAVPEITNLGVQGPQIEHHPNTVSEESQQGRQNPRARRRSFEEEFNHNSLQYLTQNLDNLREILQIVVTNADLAQTINSDIQNRNSFNIGVAQALSNVQTSILNSQNQIYDQLHDIRRIIDENQGGEQNSNSLFDILNQNNNNANRNNNNPLLSWLTSRFANKFRLRNMKTSNVICGFILLLSIFFMIIGSPSISVIQKRSFPFIIEWLFYYRQSILFMLGFTMFYLVTLLKGNEKLYEYFFPSSRGSFFKEFYKALFQSNALFDLSFLTLTNFEIIDNKFDFFFVLSILSWYIMINKMTLMLNQQLNSALMLTGSNQESEHLKIKNIQYITAIYAVLNLQASYGIIWLLWNVSERVSLILIGITLIGNIESIKIFLSTSILLRNYSLITNNNTSQLTDPKFKVELVLDFVYQSMMLFMIFFLAFTHTKYLIGFLMWYWLCVKKTVYKLSVLYKKYWRWKQLQKKIDEIFPIIKHEDNNSDDFCSICREKLLIARKIPCGHLFHLKCLIYWLENQKTCPNCRSDIGNITDIVGTNQHVTAFTRLLRRAIHPFVNLLG